MQAAVDTRPGGAYIPVATLVARLYLAGQCLIARAPRASGEEVPWTQSIGAPSLKA